MSMPKTDDEFATEDELISYAASVLKDLKINLEAHSIWMRRNNMDSVLGAHLRRATAALESTILLAENGFSYDAAATARVILEHSLSAASIAFSDDPEQEAYFFIARQWRYLRDDDKRLRDHYPELVPSNDETEEWVNDIVRDSDKSVMSDKLNKIVKELDARDPSKTSLFSWLYEVPYRQLSTFVHARALGLSTLSPQSCEPFAFEVRQDKAFAANTVRLGMLGYLVMMIAIDKAWSAGDYLSTIALEPLEDFIRRAGPVGTYGVVSPRDWIRRRRQ